MRSSEEAIVPYTAAISPYHGAIDLAVMGECGMRTFRRGGILFEGGQIEKPVGQHKPAGLSIVSSADYRLGDLHGHLLGLGGFLKGHHQNALLADRFHLLEIHVSREIEITLETSRIALIAEAVCGGGTGPG